MTYNLLVIAGLDPSGGAGILADTRVAGEHGIRTVGVVTALTVQDTQGVVEVASIPPEIVQKQLLLLLSDCEVNAVKVGVLGDEDTAIAIAETLGHLVAPVIWDPILISSRDGRSLLSGDPTRVARAMLPRCRVVTPNLIEAQVLSKVLVKGVADMRQAAEVLHAAGARAVLVKGGRLAGPRVTDLLLDGNTATALHMPRIDVRDVHGQGCVMSTKLACELVLGTPLPEAFRRTKEYVSQKLVASMVVGRGARCLV